jgi:hypothetical protein
LILNAIRESGVTEDLSGNSSIGNTATPRSPVERASRELGWHSEVKLKDGLRLTYRYFHQRDRKKVECRANFVKRGTISVIEMLLNSSNLIPGSAPSLIVQIVPPNAKTSRASIKAYSGPA